MLKNTKITYALMMAVAVAVIALFTLGIVDRVQDPASVQEAAQSSME